MEPWIPLDIQPKKLDPDPDWIRIQSGQWTRIRIRIRNPDQESKKDPQK
jgi:hypothetical protein